MGSLFEMLGKNPIWIFVIILAVVCIIVSIAKKKNPQQNNGSTFNGVNGGDKTTPTEEIGDKDEVVKPSGWYRTQDVEQPVITRTEEQQRIVDEYFIIRNYTTTNCISAYKKKHKTMKLISNFVLPIGLVLAGINLIKTGFDFKAAFENAWFIIGLITTVGGIVCKIVANNFKKKFEESIKRKTAPKKVMTDAEFEQLVTEKIESMNIAQLGLDRLGLDSDQVKEIHPIVLSDKVFDEVQSFIVYNEKDGSLHSSTQHVTYLYFTDEQLFIYKIQFDMCCNVQDEWAKEFFYKDICDISSHTKRNILRYGNSKIEYSTVAFSITSTNSEIGFALDGDNENIGSIQAMKQKIREKKDQ